MTRHAFDPLERDAVYRAIRERRDMRHFAAGEVPQEQLQRLLQAAHQAPSVGLMQPWRFVRITLLVAALPPGREAHVFGRRTMPDMDLASVACAIQNLWLAARAEGLGLGWVSLFDPQALADLLALPTGARPVAVLCLGPVDAFYSRPMLEQEHWTEARPLADMLFTDQWEER